MSSRVGLEEPGSPPWISTPRPHASSNDTVFQVGCLLQAASAPKSNWSNLQSSSQGEDGRRLDERSRTKSESRGRSAEDSSMSRGRRMEEEGGLVRGRSAEEGGMLDLLRSDIRTPRRPLEVI